MSKFKVSDKVRRKDGGTFSNGRYTARITSFQSCADLEFEQIYLDTGYWVRAEGLELVDDKSKYHKHHDLIIQWAKGAKIQVNLAGFWYGAPHPEWNANTEYRVNPTAPKTDKERIAELEDRVQELENQ